MSDGSGRVKAKEGFGLSFSVISFISIEISDMVMFMFFSLCCSLIHVLNKKIGKYEIYIGLKVRSKLRGFSPTIYFI